MISIKEFVVIAKDYLSAVYLPDWDHNVIGELHYDPEYHIKTSQFSTLNLYGRHFHLEEIPRTLAQVCNIISYLRLNTA